jgi:four helix bundle protein
VNENIASFRELVVWQKAIELAMDVYRESIRFPSAERFALTDELRRSSRSVPGNVAEAWRRRQSPAAFANKLNEAEGEAAQTQSHLEFCLRCGYLNQSTAKRLDDAYEEVLSMLVKMAVPPGRKETRRRRQTQTLHK